MPVPNSIDDLSHTPSENFPLGTEQVFPNLDNYMRFYAACLAQLRDRVTAEGVPLATTLWWGGARSAIKARFLPKDGQVLTRANYPDLWALVASGGYPLVSEGDWVASPLKRASFSTGNGATTFRLPDLNGVQGGSIGAVTTRGDGAYSAGAGMLQDGQNMRHGHGLAIDAAGAHVHGVNDPGHAHGGAARPGFGVHYASTGPHQSPSFGVTDGSGTGISLSSAGHHGHGGSISWEGGNEARMKSATGAWVMRVK